ncbi:MAG: BrnT family toxin [Patescibacteria group bacterium]
MESFDWDEQKNTKLKNERGISFELALGAILSDNLISVERNPSSKHSNQFMYIIKMNNYCYLVPFVKHGKKIFLKTIIPSRKATKKYINN